MDPASLLSWSFPLGRLGGVAVRCHWTLLLSCAFLAVGAAQQQLWFLILPALLVPALVVALHAVAVLGMARATRGRLAQATLWAAGTLPTLEQPARPWPVGLVAAAGPLAMAGLWAGLHWGAMPYVPTAWVQLVGWTQATAALVGLINLLPHAWFDGGRLWRALLWKPLGIRLAASAVAVLGIAAGVIIAGYGLVGIDPMALLSGALMVVGSVQERRALREGFDPVLHRDLAFIDREPGWWERWRRARAAAAAERLAREEAAEQETLDRLLAKVSEQGLPSLTAAERSELQRISAAQRARR